MRLNPSMQLSIGLNKSDRATKFLVTKEEIKTINDNLFEGGVEAMVFINGRVMTNLSARSKSELFALIGVSVLNYKD